MIISRPDSFGARDKAFGFLRLLLASLVIVSHTPELIDGGRGREPLTSLFHTLSFGEVAVDGFFLISGFLITSSYLASSGATSFLRKRVARIYPGFIVSSLLCVLVVGPLAGGYFSAGYIRGVAQVIVRAGILSPPLMANVFDGSYAAALNTAVWTIQYEFICYLIVLGLGIAGLLRNRWFLGLSAAACLMIFSFSPPSVGDFLNGLGLNSFIIHGDRLNLFRFVGLFFAGAFFYLVQGSIVLSRRAAVGAGVLVCGTLCMPSFATIGFAIFGAYLLFAAATYASGTWVARINNDRTDISYGLYLYAWPVTKLLLWWQVASSPLVVGLLTWLLAAAAGTLSWFLIEKPVMEWVRASGRRTRRPRDEEQARPAEWYAIDNTASISA